MLNHLESITDLLVCALDTGETTDDLSKLPCGHNVSRHEWQEYEESNPQSLGCPLCRRPVRELGATLPLQEVHENCRWLKETLSWEGGLSDPYTPRPSF